MCDEAWERVRSNDGVHDGLQAECAQLRGENSNLQQVYNVQTSTFLFVFVANLSVLRNSLYVTFSSLLCFDFTLRNLTLKYQERKSLACACAILFGALYPTLRARDELVQQRSLLVRINNDGEACKQKMR